MYSLTPQDRLREASVVLADDERDAWLAVIERSGRLKTTRGDLLDRVRLAFGEHDPAASQALGRALLKSGPKAPEGANQLIAVLAGAQLVELFRPSSRSLTHPSAVDAAALAVRILARTSKPSIFPDLATHAGTWLKRRGDAVRAVKPVTRPEPEPTEVGLELEGVRVEVSEYEALRVAHNRLGQQVMAVETALSKSRVDIEALADAVSALERARDLMAEQQQIGWWVLSGPDSPSLDWSWAYASASALNDLTRVLPGPRAAPALIRQRAGHGSWDPRPLVTEVSFDGDSRLSPALQMLRGEMSPLTEVESAEEAAMAIYDELLLARLMTR